MDNNFILKRGKYAGKTIEWIEKNNPSYLAWVKENAIGLLKGSETTNTEKEIKFRDNSPKIITPNTNFWNEGPDEISKAYLKIMEEKDGK
jgi:hypothetical protein